MESSQFLQAEVLINYYFGLSEAQIDNLSDDDFVNLSAQAFWLDHRQRENVKWGVAMGVSKLLEK